MFIILIYSSIDYLNKTYDILSDEPSRADSMIFSQSMVKLANDSSSRFNPNMDSLLQKDLSGGVPSTLVKYFYFYKN